MDKDQKELFTNFELMGKWLQLFGKGMRLKRGLNKQDRVLIRKYTKQILSKRQNLRSDKHE